MRFMEFLTKLAILKLEIGTACRLLYIICCPVSIGDPYNSLLKRKKGLRDAKKVKIAKMAYVFLIRFLFHRRIMSMGS